MKWIRFCNATELNLRKTLLNGQSFRWTPLSISLLSDASSTAPTTLTISPSEKEEEEDEIVYCSAIGNDILVMLREMKDGQIAFQARQSLTTTTQSDPHAQLNIEECVSKYLHDYFRMDIDICALYNDFCGRDVVFEKATVCGNFDGVRLLRLDPSETLIAFLTSQNNNIKRISGLIESLCCKYGQLVWDFSGSSIGKNCRIYSFPEIETLVGRESELRELGFGYRAKYISHSSQQLLEMSIASGHKSISSYLMSLRNEYSYPNAKSELMKLIGIGAKVADCICLFALDKHEAIPVDTHVKSIATKSYGYRFGNVNKTLTPQDYSAIQLIFQERFGKYSGWAHSILFTADLSRFQSSESKENQSLNKKRKLK